MITLSPSKIFRFPVIAECITPHVLEGKTVSEIEQFTIWEGNKQRKLHELFKIEQTKHESETETVIVTIKGDVSKVRRIGASQQNGEIFIDGDVGMHLGEEMKGGKITVNGNVGSWVGTMMKGGEIEIHGNAGSYLGAPYRGSTKGMHGGRITVTGNVGHEAGASMKNGTIKIYGNAGQFTGLRMQGGTVFVQGDCDDRVGACMTGGKIVVSGILQSVLPSFSIDSIKSKVKVEEDEVVQGQLYVFLGDLTECGNGKLYVSKQKNPQFSIYEKYL